MESAVYIFVDDDFAKPVYAEPSPDTLDEDLWALACQAIDDALEGDGPVKGYRAQGQEAFAWLTQRKFGISFLVVVGAEVPRRDLTRYLKDLSQAYFDEVDDVRRPDLEGVGDVVVDVVPPWED